MKVQGIRRKLGEVEAPKLSRAGLEEFRNLRKRRTEQSREEEGSEQDLAAGEVANVRRKSFDI